MDKLKELRQLKADLNNKKMGFKAQYDELHPAIMAGTLSDEQKTKLETIKSDMQAVTAQIEQVEASIVDYEAFADLEREQKGFVVSEAALNAAKPKQQPFASFGEQLAAIAASANPRNGVDPRLLEVQNAASGSAAAVDSDGGYLIQSDFANELMERAFNTGEILNRITPVEISSSSNRLTYNQMDEDSRVDGSRHGGVQVFWEDEANAPDATKIKLKQSELKLQKIIGLTYMTEELVQDAAAMSSLTTRSFEKALRFKLEDGIVRGTGAGQPLGILNSSALVTVDKETGQGAGTIVYENINKMWSRANAVERRNMVWLINQEIEPELDTMTISAGTGGAPVYLPAGGVADVPYGRLKGRPVIPVEYCSALGSLGDILLVNLEEYLMITKGSIRSDQSIHVKFTTDERAFRFVMRANGQPYQENPLTPYQGTNTLSSFVALAARA